MGLAHDLEVGGVVALGLGDVSGPQAVAGEEAGIEPGRPGGTLDHCRHRLAGQASQHQAAMAVDGAEHRPGADAGGGQPGP